MKIVFSDPKSGRSGQLEVKLENAAILLNKKIGETIDGTSLGMSGYKLKITGGSDKSGFPMDRSIEGTAKSKVLSVVATSGRQKGQFMRQSRRGAVISADTEQVNMVVVENGEKPFDEIFPKKEKPKEEKKAEEKKPEKKEKK